ncbi:hypothetical protein Tco_1145971 [Tanacetum coccineum]
MKKCTTKVSWESLCIPKAEGDQAGDDLRVKPPDKINKRKANDELNDEQVTERTEGFFFEPEECMPCSCDDCNSTSSSKEDEPEASSKA